LQVPTASQVFHVSHIDKKNRPELYHTPCNAANPNINIKERSRLVTNIRFQTLTHPEPDVGICCNLKLTNLLSWKLTRSCSTISSDLAQKIFNNIITLMGIDISILYHPLTTFLVLQQVLQMSLIDLLILHNWQSSHGKKKESERQQWACNLCWSIPQNHVWQFSIIYPQQNIAKMLQQSEVANVWHTQFRTC
jgi:hypothetical protein